jgi:hydroxyacylglutathione hydrolase
MYIEQIYTNCLAEAAYYIESNGEAAIIDPIRDIDVYLELAKKRGAKIKYVLETHFHADFVSGHLDLSKATGAPIIYGPGAETKFKIRNVRDDEMLPLGATNIQVLHTPGHTPESVSYLLFDDDNIEYAVFTGDTLFIGDVGRPDLLGGKMSKEELASMMYDSLNNKIKVLPDEVIVYPAHGAGSACGKNISKETSSTIGKQKATNYALQEMSRAEFIKVVTDGLANPPAYFPFDAVKNKSGYSSLEEVIKNSKKPLSPSMFSSEMQKGSFVLDTRKADLFAKGFIKGAINVGLDGQYATWVGNLVPPNSNILLVTDVGKEEESIIRLARIGYDSVVGYLDGGMAAWIATKFIFDKINEITPEEFVVKFNNGPLHILDVRNKGECESGIVKGAQAICLSKLPGLLHELSPEFTYFVHCAGGYRSMMACSLLKKNDFANVVNVRGGIQMLKKLKIPMDACKTYDK